MIVLDPHGTPDPQQERRNYVEIINAQPKERAELEERWGQVWDTAQLSTDFGVIGFMSPMVKVFRRLDGVKGHMIFQHLPRYYFHFTPEETT
jgi:hypothetical protein